MKTKIFKSLLSIAVPVFLILGTLGIFFYVKGYRININTQEIERTGVISVLSEPKKAEIQIDHEQTGKTPKAISGISQGTHTVTVSKEGYFDWSANVQIEIEQSIPVHATLFLKSPQIETIFPNNSDEQNSIDKIFFDDNNRLTVFTTILSQSEEIETTDSDMETTISEILQIWTYPTNKRFWQLYTEPQMIAEFPGTVFDLAYIDIQISSDTQKLLVEIRHLDDEIPHYYILDSDTQNTELIETINIAEYTNISPTWTNDSQYIITSKNNELRSFNIATGARAIISEKNDEQQFIWTSDQEDLIYLVDESDSQYSVHRVHNNGENKITVLENIQIPVKRELFADPTEDQQDSTIPHYSHQVRSISVSKDGKNIIVFTEQQIHIHSTLSDEFENIPAKEPVFISFSPTEDRFLYLDNQNMMLKIYTVSVKDGNPTHSIGSEMLLDINTDTSYHNFQWCPKELNILYSTGEIPTSLHAISIEGHNMFEIFNLGSTTEFSIGNSGKYLISLCEDNSLCKITVRE